MRACATRALVRNSSTIATWIRTCRGLAGHGPHPPPAHGLIVTALICLPYSNRTWSHCGRRAAVTWASTGVAVLSVTRSRRAAVVRSAPPPDQPGLRAAMSGMSRARTRRLLGLENAKIRVVAGPSGKRMGAPRGRRFNRRADALRHCRLPLRLHGRRHAMRHGRPLVPPSPWQRRPAGSRGRCRNAFSPEECPDARQGHWCRLLTDAAARVTRLAAVA